MKQAEAPYLIHSISDLHRLLGLPSPDHPLVSMIRLADLRDNSVDMPGRFVYQFHSVCIKKDFNGKLKYGQQYYDFDNGTMTFFAPGQVVSVESGEESCFSGWWLAFHPEFLTGHPLATKVSQYGFFGYAVNEALHLSEKEEVKISSIMENIAGEYRHPIDAFSQTAMLAQLELLLTYADRYYQRQFTTRKKAGNDLLSRVESVLDRYLEAGTGSLPTVQYIAGQVHVSPHYLSDQLRITTGRNTQQLIQDKIIERAKLVLSTTSLTVSEIAYQLGFEHPQSFNKLFKNKTRVSPLAFRESFQ